MFNGTTTTEMSSSERAKCRENLKQQWETRQVNEALLLSAWEAAHRVATALYQDYGASKVAVFGSLAEREWFHEHSDIDIAVWGLTHDKCLDASSDIDELECKFVIELIAMNCTKGLFRERIQQHSMVIKKEVTDVHNMVCEAYNTTSLQNGQVYVTHKNKLIQRITDELHAIKHVIERIAKALEEKKEIQSDCIHYIEKCIKMDLISTYRGIEKIFLRIAREVDMDLPPGSEYPKDKGQRISEEWAYQLISQMETNRQVRPAVITSGTSQKIESLLNFCAYYDDNLDQHELIYEKAEKHAKRVSKLFENVSEELDTFVAFLSET